MLTSRNDFFQFTKSSFNTSIASMSYRSSKASPLETFVRNTLGLSGHTIQVPIVPVYGHVFGHGLCHKNAETFLMIQGPDNAKVVRGWFIEETTCGHQAVFHSVNYSRIKESYIDVTPWSANDRRLGLATASRTFVIDPRFDHLSVYECFEMLAEFDVKPKNLEMMIGTGQTLKKMVHFDELL